MPIAPFKHYTLAVIVTLNQQTSLTPSWNKKKKGQSQNTLNTLQAPRLLRPRPRQLPNPYLAKRHQTSSVFDNLWPKDLLADEDITPCSPLYYPLDP